MLLLAPTGPPSDVERILTAESLLSDPITRLDEALEGRYVIERELGEGGMATVYLAEDVRHRRKVALKVLRPDLAATLGTERFLREIEIAANLTHPHILPLHDSGEVDGFLFYVLPYVEGESLRDRLVREGELPVNEAVRILRDVVDALSHAHEHGVVHRDIKPDNVMLSGRHALVTDFGVAKAVSQATGRHQLTTMGVALGTPAYMAPEQAEASDHIDHRADIYAVGALAYELLAGQPPFAGKSPQAVLVAHLTQAPESVTEHRAAVPMPLSQWVMRCLEKKPADRWQSAEEMLGHLEALATPSGGLTPTGIMPVSAVSGPRKLLNPVMIGGAVLVGLMAFFAASMFTDDPIEIVLSNNVQVTFGPQIDFEPDLSDDGANVTYTSGFGLRTSVMSKSLADVVGGRSLALAQDLGGRQRRPRFGSNNLVLFEQSVGAGGARMFRVSGTGGIATQIVDDIRWTGDWDPSAERVTFAIGDSIMIMDVGRGEPALLTVAPPPGDPHSLSWSPDGQWIAFVNGNSGFINVNWGNVAPSSIWLAHIDGREPVLVTDRDHLNVSPAWLPDSRHLLFVSDLEGVRDVFVVTVRADGTEDEPTRLGVPEPFSISVSHDGRRLAYAEFSFNRNIRSYPIGRSQPLSVTEGSPVTSGDQIVEGHGLSSDGGSIVFDSNLRGNQDVFMRSLDGGSPIPLTTDPANDFTPDLSNDGAELAFMSTRDGFRRIFVKPVNGGPEVQVSVDSLHPESRRPIWSPDGLSIIFGDRTGTWIVHRDRVGEEWHPPVRITTMGGSWGVWTPTGDQIVFSHAESIWRTTLGGELWRLFRPSPDRSNADDVVEVSRVRLSADGSTAFFEGVDRSDSQGVWSVPAFGGQPCRMSDAPTPDCEDSPLPEPRLVVEFDSPSLMLHRSGLSVGSDSIYISVGTYQSDIWVMDLAW